MSRSLIYCPESAARHSVIPRCFLAPPPGVRFADTALSTLAPHGLPSDGGGDWAIARSAALHVSGVEGFTVEGCLFERLDGNAVMISGYSRDTTVRDNEFHLVGENGIVSWGYTADFADAQRAVPIPKTQGPDMRDGNHPQGNLIADNFFHEIGHFQKQISCYFQAQTQGSTLSRNICFNGPRAGLNFNDGGGGGDLLESNMVFNMVRETQDHGVCHVLVQGSQSQLAFPRLISFYDCSSSSSSA
eukprot:SAG11_NODE_476_length_9118_cov_5.515911_11_plen_245_part_00